uniref:Ubiquitin-like protease family profile domain-containing protein n=1 Tax=Brassica oleracea TaxID=3712 RepID=A0A3P6G4W9_BRAOL|nr:unnamed protein product [Brassica oleracea]
MTECRTPDVGNSKLSRYLTRSLKKAELEGKCIPISSTKKDDLQTKRIRAFNKDWRSVHPGQQEIEEAFPKLQETQISYSGLGESSFKSFSQFSMRNRTISCLDICINFLDCQMFNIDFWFVLKFQEIEIVIGIHVSNKFFPFVGMPTNWVSTEFEKASDKFGFNWGGLVSFSFTGKTPRRNDKKVLFVDVDRVYAPMMWGKDHWVGLVINLTCRQVEILDCNIPLNESDNEVNKHMAYLLRALPHVLAAFSPPSDCSHPEEDQAFSWVRPDNIYFNERSGDCGPCTVKFLEMHAAGYSYEDMGQIDDKKVDIFRQKYAMDTYEEFIGNAKVQNDG